MAHRRLTIIAGLGFGWLGACSTSAFDSDDAPATGDLGVGGSFSSGGSGAAAGQPSPPPPEVEADASYTAPVVSGHWIWSANPESGKVALIDAASMRVTTADAGLAPTYVAALGASSEHETAAIVLNVGNDTASILHAVDGEIEVQTAKVHPGANRMTVSDSGRWALVWSDAALLTDPDPTEGLQDVTVLDLGVSPAVSYPLTVGYRPSRVSFGAGERHGYFVTEPGISVVDLPQTDAPSVARDVALTQNPADAARVRDVTVTPDGSVAIVRHEGSPQVSVISLDDGRDVEVTLPGPVTDLDLAPDGDVAFAVVRSTTTTVGAGGTAGAGSGGGAGASSVTTGGTGASVGGDTSSAGGEANAAGAADTTSNGGQTGAFDLGGAGPGEGAGAPNGGQGASGAPAEGGAPATAGVPGSAGTGEPEAGAPSTSGGSSNAGSGGGPTTVTTPSYIAALPLSTILDDPTTFAQIAIDDTVGSIAVAPAGDVALLFTNATPSDHVTIFDTHAFAVVRTVLVKSPVKTVLPAPDGLHAIALLDQASGSQKPGGFSLIPLTTTLAPKVVGTDAPLQSVALGAHHALITVEGTDPVKNLPVHAVYLATLPELGTTKLTLASPPLSAGLIPEVNRGFVAQSHPEGRITFVNLDTAQPQTLTGFELSARVVQGD